MSRYIHRLRADEFEWRCWDGEALIYDDRSGDTHRLARPSGLLLERLARTPEGLPREALARDVAGQSAGDETSDPGDEAFVHALEVLVELGIVDQEAFLEDR